MWTARTHAEFYTYAKCATVLKMECVCSTKHLAEAAATALRIVKKKNSLPVLSCFLITTRKSEFTIVATNLETGIELTVPAEIGKDGAVAISADVFTRLVQTITAPKVTLSVEDGLLIVSSSAGRSTIKPIPHDDFPKLPRTTTKHTHVVSAASLKAGIDAVSYSVSLSLVRPELASIYVQWDENEKALIFASTDSFRLAEKKVRFEEPVEFSEVLIPAHNALDLVATIPLAKDVHIGFDEGQMQVSSPGWYFISRVVDGTFPDYKSIIPSKYVAEAVMLKEDLVLGLKKNIIFSDESQQVRFSVNPGKKEFVMSSSNSVVGETTERLDAALSGESLQINFNLRYLSECLSHVASDSISMSFGGAGKPLVIRGVSDASYLYLVMPLNR